MGRGTDIRRNLLILAGVALAMFVLLIGALFIVQATMTAQQHRLSDIHLPVQEDVTDIQASMGAAFARQGSIASSTSLAQLETLRERDKVEKGLTSAQGRLREHVASVGDDGLQIRADSMGRSVGEFLESDTALFEAIARTHGLNNRFRDQLALRNAELREQSRIAQNILDRIRLARVLLLRRLAMGDAAAGKAALDIRVRAEAAADLGASIQLYALLVARMGTLSSGDALNSTLANELPQAGDRAREAIAQLADIVEGDAELAPTVTDLHDRFERVVRTVSDKANPESLAFLRYAQFDEQAHADRVRASCAATAKELLADAEELESRALETARRTTHETELRMRVARYLSLLLALLGVAFCFFGYRRIGQSVAELGENNRRLSELQQKLLEVNANIEGEVVAKTAELKANMDRYRTLVENTNAVPWEMDARTFQVSYISPQARRIFGPESDLAAKDAFWAAIHADDRGRVREQVAKLAGARREGDLDLSYRVISASDDVVDVRTILSCEMASDGERGILRGLTFDVTQQKKLEFDLNQAQRLEAVGRLASGVAHEINTPVQFVSDSVHFLRDGMRDLTGLIERYRSLSKTIEDGAAPADAVAEIARAEEEADLEYLLENMPGAIDRSLDGLDRVATIVRSMKAFAHPDQKEMTAANLNDAIESTLTIARNEYKYVADVEVDLGEIPPVTCYVGDVNQAFLNIVVNAAHAIEDVVRGTERKGRITVRTRRDGDSVVIAISDTGGGIPEPIRARIFDPFFTTKEVGKGTGQGLAIARSVVHEKHGGELWCESEVGHGTTFFIRLPLEGKKREVGEAA